MGKNLIEFEHLQLEKLKEIAFKNKLKMNNQSIVNLAVSIANNSIQYLECEDFKQINSLTK